MKTTLTAPEQAPDLLRTTHEFFAVDDTLSPPQTVALLLNRAIAIGASDLFLSAAQNALVASVRHLGVVRTLGRLDPEYGRHCRAHLRAEAGLDIAEHRRPQDGRWTYQASSGKTVDLRVCSLPTLHGEDVSVRILDRELSERPFDQLGLGPSDHERLTELLGYPGGLILVTGPTGGGKTTTLYSCLRYLNNGQRRIHTIEDPVEYDIPGIHQSQPNVKLGLHFPDLLRGIVRQGPDVIMIGEIRDPETAATAVSAANSGHLVLATLHAPVGAGGVASMLAYGVAPHFLATSLIGITAQRLVRTFCPGCRFPVEAARAAVDLVAPGCGAPGCPVCQGTGFAARTALFEVLTVTRAIRDLIQARQPTQVIEKQAYLDGMTGFRHAAQVLIARGQTDLTEIRRCIPPACVRGDEAA